MTQYVQLSSDAVRVVTLFAGPQAITSDKPGYAEVADDDARYVTWLALRAAIPALRDAVSAGCAVVSSGTPALSGTYGIAPQDEINITGLQTSVLAGVTWLGYYRNMAGTKITMTATEFTTLATAILDYIAALDDAYEAAVGGGAWVAPAQPVTIA